MVDWENGVFEEECVCGGSTNTPNDDCERCQLVKEIGRLRRELARARESAESLRTGAGRLWGYRKHCPVCGTIEGLHGGCDCGNLKAKGIRQ